MQLVPSVPVVSAKSISTRTRPLIGDSQDVAKRLKLLLERDDLIHSRSCSVPGIKPFSLLELNTYLYAKMKL